MADTYDKTWVGLMLGMSASLPPFSLPPWLTLGVLCRFPFVVVLFIAGYATSLGTIPYTVVELLRTSNAILSLSPHR